MSSIGKKAEEFAFAWEKERLRGANLDHLVEAIDDRRDRPGYGYDFLSHSADRTPRFVEVKSVGWIPEGHRFFLSDNEYTVSCSREHRGAYYFYLVFFDGAGEPTRLLPLLAADLYQHAEIEPASYTVRFDVGHSAEEK
jgi:alkyl sulfatase BDS1-like metallo-beta-lactamase superfamily hydrolase